jgi:DNA-binding NarL/FixJ family response regulator
LRVVIAEDLALLRDGMVRLLEANGFEVAGAVDNGDALVHAVRLEQPDVAIVDIRLPPSFRDEGLRAALELRQTAPEVGILVVSQYVERTYATELLAGAGAAGGGGIGYLLKDRVMNVDDFVEAVRRVGSGGAALDPEVVAQLLGRRGASPLDDLSPREREVLALMAEGRSNAGIAEALVLTVSAVEKHVASIFHKLRLAPSDSDHRRVLAVLAYLEQSDGE